MPCIACSNKNDNICMGICLPSREQMTAELKKIKPEDQHEAIEGYDDIRIGDIYYELIHIKPTPPSIATSILRAVQRDHMNETTLHFDYQETTPHGSHRTFNGVIYIRDTVTGEQYLLGGFKLHEGLKNDLGLKSLLCRVESEQVVLNSLGMFGGLAKSFISIEVDTLEERLINNVFNMQHSNLYEFCPSGNTTTNNNLIFKAIPSKEFFSSVSKGNVDSKDMHTIYTHCMESDNAHNELERLNPFPFELPKKIKAYTEPFAQSKTGRCQPKIN